MLIISGSDRKALLIELRNESFSDTLWTYTLPEGAYFTDVVILDIDAERVNKINKLESPIVDKKTEYFLANKKLQLRATVNKEDAYRKSDFIIIPGVGAFSHGMNNLNKYGLVDIIKDYVEMGKPLLGICLGMQMLLEESEVGSTFPTVLRFNSKSSRGT